MTPWWKNKDYVHLLVHFARELDAQYKGRLLVALGHSPSWLVVAAGMCRVAEGQPRNTAFIPFTGRHCELDSGSYELRGPVDTIMFRPDDVRIVSDQSVAHYFNDLARHKRDPKSLRHKAGAEKPVLVELASHGLGLASFLNVMQRQMGPAGAAQFDVVLYKLNYTDGVKRLSYVPETKRAAADPQAVHPQADYTVEARVISGPAGAFLDRFAGSKGRVSSWDKSEQEVGRFMPYYSVVDGYNPDSYFARCAPPVRQYASAESHAPYLRGIKKAIRAAIAAPKEEHEAHVQRGLADLAKITPVKIAGGWVPVYRGYH